MHPRTLLLLSGFFGIQGLFAQQVPDSINLVPNGGFEVVDGKLKKKGSIEMATGWKAPTGVKADLFSENVTGAVSAPKNEFGEQGPLSGSNYAGVMWWSYMNKEPRSYLQVKFRKMLTKGQKYCVRYYVSLADASKYAAAEHGAYISRMMVKKDDPNHLTYEAQVPTLKTKIYDDLFSWQGVCGVYDAKGDEQYLIVGNFAANEKTNTTKVKRPKGLTTPQLNHAYYYIDDVAVFPVRTMSECTCEQLDKAESEFIYSRRGMINKTLPPSQQVDAVVIYFKRFQSGVDGAMENTMNDVLTILKENPTINIRLVGHIDTVEEDRTRIRPDLLELAKQRAESVKAALVEEGVDAARIITAAVGATAPADAGDSEVSLSKNRRVEFELQ